MKVSDLRNALKGLPDDMTIVMQADSEGNSYRRLCGADPNGLIMEDGYGMVVYDNTWDANDAGMDEEEWEEAKMEKETCVVLWPV